MQLQPRQFRGKGIHVHVRILRPRVEIWILSSYWPSQCDRKRICLATSTQPYSQHTIVYTVSTNKIYRVDTLSKNNVQLLIWLIGESILIFSVPSYVLLSFIKPPTNMVISMQPYQRYIYIPWLEPAVSDPADL